jgi:hypothetical protein
MNSRERAQATVLVAGVLGAGMVLAPHLPGGHSPDHRHEYVSGRSWGQLGEPVTNYPEHRDWTGTPIEHQPLTDAPADPEPSAGGGAKGGKCMEDEPCWNPATMGNGRGGVPGTGASAPSSPVQGAASSGVVVDDETGGAFDVPAAVAAWGLPGVRMGSCQAGTSGCVTVRLSDLSSAPGTIHEGQTTWRAAGTASVRLSPRTRPSDRMHVVVHELGHAWALRHQPGTVMEARDDGRFRTPTSSERAAARRNLGR